MAEPRVLVAIPDGVAYRNLVLSGLTGALAERARLSFLVPRPLILNIERAEQDRAFGSFAGIAQEPLIELLRYPDRLLEALCRRTLEYEHMRHFGSFGMRFNLARGPRGSWRKRLLQSAALQASRLVAATNTSGALGAVHRAVAAQRVEIEHYTGVLRATAPDLVLFGHQRSLAVLPLALAARARGVPSATLVFSWDNLTSKERITTPFDHYLVWSELMKAELLRFYPSLPASCVDVVGAPQFEIYAKDVLGASRQDFFAALGVDPRRPVICYSGGDRGTCPEDPEHVAVLAQAILDGQIARDAQIVVRPSPADLGDRFAQVCARYPSIVLCPPAWVGEPGQPWSQVVPTERDAYLMANLTAHADVNVNVASTMTLDFALHDRPVVNVGFDIASPPPHGIGIGELSRRMEHYRPVLELGAARLAESATSLAREVQRYLDDPARDRDARRAIVEMQLSVRPGQARQRFVAALEQRGWL